MVGFDNALTTVFSQGRLWMMDSWEDILLNSDFTVGLLVFGVFFFNSAEKMQVIKVIGIITQYWRVKVKLQIIADI